jgi:dihydroorotate dehydrogenase (fumarate)
MTISLATTYLGLELPSPLVVGAAAPLSTDLQRLQQLEQEGAGAVVLHSLFLEQIERDWMEWIHHQQHSRESHPEALSYLPAPDPQHLGLEGYLEEIRRAREALSIPVIASLNGTHAGHWSEAALALQQAGAAAIELNLYRVPSSTSCSSAELEAEQLEIVRQVCSALSVPVAVKLSPWYTGLAAMTGALAEAGARGAVLFNRFLQPEIDIDTLSTDAHLELSHRSEQRLPLRWIGLLHGRVALDLAASTGIDNGRDVLRMLMVGAQICQVVSALLRHGPGQLQRMRNEMQQWLAENQIESLASLRGSLSQQRNPNPEAFERAQYLRALSSYALPATWTER